MDVNVFHHFVDSNKAILTKLEAIMANQQALVEQVSAVVQKLEKIGTETNKLLEKIEELKTVIESGPVTPELQEAINQLVQQAQVVDDLVPDEEEEEE